MESVEYKITFIVFGDNIECDMFDKLRKYGVVKYVKKGQMISRILPPAKCDSISFSYKASGCLRKSFSKFFDIINEIDVNDCRSKGYGIRLRLFIQSDYAQIEFCLYKEIIELIKRNNMDLEISILSWGGVEDD